MLGRPVHFVDGDPQLMRRAGAARKGRPRSRLQAYRFPVRAYRRRARLRAERPREELALIVDIGGGTSDFSIVRVSPERATAADRKDDILANTGVHIGGTDFDRLLSMAHLMPQLGYKTATKDGNAICRPAISSISPHGSASTCFTRTRR